MAPSRADHLHTSPIKTTVSFGDESPSIFRLLRSAKIWCRPDCGLNRSDCQDVGGVASAPALQEEEGRGVKGQTFHSQMRGRKFRLLERPMPPGKFDSSKSSIR